MNAGKIIIHAKKAVYLLSSEKFYTIYWQTIWPERMWRFIKWFLPGWRSSVVEMQMTKFLKQLELNTFWCRKVRSKVSWEFDAVFVAISQELVLEQICISNAYWTGMLISYLGRCWVELKAWESEAAQTVWEAQQAKESDPLIWDCLSPSTAWRTSPGELINSFAVGMPKDPLMVHKLTQYNERQRLRTLACHEKWPCD